MSEYTDEEFETQMSEYCAKNKDNPLCQLMKAAKEYRVAAEKFHTTVCSITKDT